MATSTKPATRPIAVLKLPKNNAPRFITYAQSIVDAMTGNPHFPSPNLPLADVQTANDALARAESATRTRTAGTVEVRNARRLAVKILLQQLCAYVQSIADADREHAASIIESAGMSVKRRRTVPPVVFRAENVENHSGVVKLFAPKAGNRAAYAWQYSLDEMKTWIDLDATAQASTTVSGLPRGALVYFRYRATVKKRKGDWSDPISIRVT